MAKISIVIPIYNIQQDVLLKMYKSVIEQTYEDIEIIIVDDGSNKQCADFCDYLSSLYSRTKVIHQANQGLSAARNTGVKCVTSQWFMFLDGDDWIERDLCEQITSYLNPEINVYTFGIYRNQGKKQSLFPMKYYQDNPYINDNCKKIRSLSLDSDSYISTAYAKVFNTCFLTNNNLWHDEELKSGIEGIEFCYRVFDAADSIQTLSYYGYHYVYNESSLSSRPSEKSNQLIVKGLRKIESYILSHPDCYDDLKLLYKRALYVLMATATRSYFNVTIKMSYKDRKNLMSNFILEPIFQRSLQLFDENEIQINKSYLLRIIKSKKYLCLYLYSLLSYLRTKYISKKQ